MIRTLFIIAGAALVLCAVTIGGALAIGGNDMARHGWAWTIQDEDGQNIRIERVKSGGTDDLGPVVTRTLAWTGGDALVIDDSIDVEYVQGDQAGVVVTGPQGLAERVRLDNGRLSLGEGEERVVFGWDSGNLRARSERDELKVVVTAPSVVRFELNGSQRLSIAAYDQPTLTVALSGSGEVEATGRTDSLDLNVSGSGEVDLSGLTVRDADVSISGSGDVRVGPTGEADIAIAGSGDVDLTSRPARLNTSVSGSGEIHQ